MDTETMEKPTPPTLEEYGLTEQELLLVPKLLNQKITRALQLKIGLIGGIIFGLGSLWGMFLKTASMIHGAFFGILIGFVVFLMVSFLGSSMIVLIANVISFFQSLYYGRINIKTRRAYQYFDANRKYDKSMKHYERYRQKRY